MNPQFGNLISVTSRHLALRDGIRSEGKPLVADIAYVGVRIGGTPFLSTQWR
jgi:hypothetical protein